MEIRHKQQSTRKSWYKLDLSANVYPTLQKPRFSSVYRISAELTEEINPELLQRAVNLTMPRFPTFSVAMRKGFFWRYLEPNKRPGPFVKHDVQNPCMPMPFKANNRYLIRFYYFRRRISMDVFHSLSDGAGALVLMKTLLAVYLRLNGHSIPCTDGVLNIHEEPDPEELEDAYIRYATSRLKPPRKQEKAYLMRGTKEPFYTLNIICGVIPADIILKKAKSYGVSLTEYLNAVFLHALLKDQRDHGFRKERPVKLAMPVSLRQFFPSGTLRNFITMVYPSFDPRYGDYTFEDILREVHHYMRYHITPRFLRADITTNASTQQNPMIRIIPLFLKDFIVRQFYNRVQNKQSSAGLTNLGRIIVPEAMAEHLTRFDVLMGQPFSTRTNCAVVSYDNTLSVSFASSIVETQVEMYFFRHLVQEGIPVKIESNRNREV